jgi:hypothetical protein
MTRLDELIARSTLYKSTNSFTVPTDVLARQHAINKIRQTIRLLLRVDENACNIDTFENEICNNIRLIDINVGFRFRGYAKTILNIINYVGFQNMDRTYISLALTYPDEILYNRHIQKAIDSHKFTINMYRLLTRFYIIPILYVDDEHRYDNYENLTNVTKLCCNIDTTWVIPVLAETNVLTHLRIKSNKTILGGHGSVKEIIIDEYINDVDNTSLNNLHLDKLTITKCDKVDDTILNMDITELDIDAKSYSYLNNIHLKKLTIRNLVGSVIVCTADIYIISDALTNINYVKFTDMPIFTGNVIDHLLVYYNCDPAVTYTVYIVNSAGITIKTIIIM